MADWKAQREALGYMGLHPADVLDLMDEIRRERMESMVEMHLRQMGPPALADAWRSLITEEKPMSKEGQNIITIPARDFRDSGMTTVNHDNPMTTAVVHLDVKGEHGRSLNAIEADRLAAALLRVGPADDTPSLRYKHIPSVSRGSRSIEVARVLKDEDQVVVAVRDTETTAWSPVVYATLTPEEAERYAAAILVRAAQARENAGAPKTKTLTLTVEVEEGVTGAGLAERLKGTGVVSVKS